MHQYQERRRGKQKTLCKGHMENVGLREEDVMDSTMWNNDIHNGIMIFITIPVTQDDGKSPRRRRRTVANLECIVGQFM